MKFKNSIVAIVCSFASIALIFLCLLIFMICTDSLSKRTAGIVVPAEGGYVEAWSEHVPQVARYLEIPEVTIYTYDSYEELKSYLLQSDKYNILWAEIPVSGEYNLNKLINECNLSNVDEKVASMVPSSLFNAINSTAQNAEIKFLPLSYNPYILVERNTKKTSFLFDISLGGNNDSTALAFLNYVSAKNDIDVDKAIEKITTMSNNKMLIKNARTFTNKDAFIALENETAKYCYIPIWFFNFLSISQRQEVIIEPMENNLICDATFAVFPVRKSDENNEKVEMTKEILLSPDMMYATANSRGWLPALTSTVSRSSYTDSIKKQAKTATNCFIPSLQFQTTDEKIELIEKLNFALRTKVID